MKSIKDTNLYSEVIKELNYPFGNVYVFDGYLVSEINEGVIFSWEEHAEQIIEDVYYFLGTDLSDLIYISNRVNSYSIIATDWVKFFKNNHSLAGYYVVGQEKSSMINTIFENLFFKSKIKKFTSIKEAIEVVKKYKLKKNIV